MSEYEVNKEVIYSAIDSFFEIEKEKMGQNFKIDPTMIEKAYRIFGNREIVNDYVVDEYPEYKGEEI